MENWNPNTSRRPVLSGIPIAVPDQKTVDRMNFPILSHDRLSCYDNSDGHQRPV